LRLIKLGDESGRVELFLLLGFAPWRAHNTVLAERTGLEPATPGVTGRYSNQLNYRSVVVTNRTKTKDLTNRALFKTLTKYWWVLQGSNLRPTPCKGVALPTELNTRRNMSANCIVFAG
jgi:hypothetical protein